MFHLVVRVVVTALALILAANVVPGISIGSFGVALIAALVLGILNVLVKPVLFILTLPITILTLGLFTFIVNALVFWLAAYFVTGFAVTGFLPALLGSLIVTAVSTVTHKVLG
jgi:putative membrane protein